MSEPNFSVGELVQGINTDGSVALITTILSRKHLNEDDSGYSVDENGRIGPLVIGWHYTCDVRFHMLIPESCFRKLPKEDEDDAAWQRFKDKLHLDLVEIKQPEEVT